MRSVPLYILLVGLPILGLLTVLHVGKGLTAPKSVGGEWTIESPSQAFERPECQPAWAHQGQALMAISQSGPNLALSFPGPKDLSLSGTIQDETVVARRFDLGREASLASTRVFEIELWAILDTQADPDRLTGRVSLSGCPSALPFIATRRPGTIPGNP